MDAAQLALTPSISLASSQLLAGIFQALFPLALSYVSSQVTATFAKSDRAISGQPMSYVQGINS